MLEIIKKYDFTNIKTEDNAEEILSILALLYHAMQMEEILAKYLRIEPDSIIYKTKCVLSKLKNKIFLALLTMKDIREKKFFVHLFFFWRKKKNKRTKKEKNTLSRATLNVQTSLS